MAGGSGGQGVDPPELAALPIPEGSTFPAADAQRSTRAEYDAYFKLIRSNPDFVEWSRTCRAVLAAQRSGIEDSQLMPEDRIRILDGANLVLQIMLEKCLDAPLDEERVA